MKGLDDLRRDLVKVAADEDRGNIEIIPHPARCVETAAAVGQPDVGQQHIRVMTRGEFISLVGIPGEVADLVSHVLHMMFQAHGDDKFIFNDQHTQGVTSPLST